MIVPLGYVQDEAADGSVQSPNLSVVLCRQISGGTTYSGQGAARATQKKSRKSKFSI